MKIAYVPKKFTASSMNIIEQANDIIEEFFAQGYDLTLRQLYYQFVSRALIANDMKEYKRLGEIISAARLAGLIDWNRIVDRTRNSRGNAHWDSPADIVSACAKQFQTDKWATQSWHVEAWVEKEALEGVLERICGQLDITYFACKGYVSQSEMWAAAQRLSVHARAGKSVLIVHLGDHDPSGLDMSRDIEDRLSLFMREQAYKLTVKRVALNMNQIDQYNPPPNPAKLNDSRSSAYVRQYGYESWELDALDPSVINDLISRAVLTVRNEARWQEKQQEEMEAKKTLRAISDNFDDIRRYADDLMLDLFRDDDSEQADEDEDGEDEETE